MFMEAGDQHTQSLAGFSAENTHALSLYMKLIREEYTELVDGYNDKDIVAVADGCGDLIWVILGLCNAAGINMASVWHEIAASNASKTVDGKLLKREDGKILKPDTYFPPNIKRALGLGE
jgi:predicted HAD superfamily Cof-like phosphohydrolase